MASSRHESNLAKLTCIGCPRLALLVLIILYRRRGNGKDYGEHVDQYCNRVVGYVIQ